MAGGGIKLVKNMRMAFKPEATYGTSPWAGAPADADYIPIISGVIKPISGTEADESIRPTHSQGPDEHFDSHSECEIEHYIYHRSGAAGTGPPEPIVALLQATGRAETIAPATSAAYSMVTTHTPAQAPSCAARLLGLMQNGQHRPIEALGCRGNMSIVRERGKRVRCRTTLQGLFADYGNAALMPAAPTNPIVSGLKPIFFLGASLQYEGSALPVKGIEYSTGWSIAQDMYGTEAYLVTELLLQRSGAPAGSLSINGSEYLDVVRDAVSSNAEGTLVIVETDGTRTFTTTLKIQFGRYDVTPGELWEFPVPFKLIDAGAGETEETLLFT